MKSKIARKTLIIYLALLLVMSVAFSIYGLNAKDVKADSVSFSTLSLEKGAYIRLKESKEDIGIRYSLKISEADYASVKNNFTDVKFGVLIVPVDYITAGRELNAANVFGIGGTSIYGWAEKDPEGNWLPYVGEKTQIINLSTDTMTLNEGVYYFYGSIVNVLDSNKAREFKGLGYMLYTENDVSKVVFVGDESNERSMAFVAQKACVDLDKRISELEPEDPQITELVETKNSLINYYITGVMATAKVNHYLLQKNGDYNLTSSSTTVSAQIGTTLSGQEDTIEGYVVNRIDSTTSEVLYPNEKTVLNYFYYQPNIGLIDNGTVTGFNYGTAFKKASGITLKQVIWEDAESMKDKTTYVGEKTKTIDLASCSTDGVIDLSALEGVYRLTATLEDETASVTFDSYNSGEMVWNDISADTTSFARIYNWSNNWMQDNVAKTAVDLTDVGHTGTYLRYDYFTDDTAKRGFSNGGFSFLSLHSKEYYEKLVEANPNTYLNFSFKVIGVKTDDSQVGLPGGGSGFYRKGTVYLNGNYSTANCQTSSEYKYEPNYISPNIWYGASISLEKLITNWDIMRSGSDERKGDSLTTAGTTNKLLYWEWNEGFDRSNFKSFDVYVGEFDIVAIDEANFIPKASMYNFYLSSMSYNDGFTGNFSLLKPNYDCLPVQMSQAGPTYTDAQGVTKDVVAKFEKITTVGASRAGRRVLMAVRTPWLTKAYLTQLIGEGKTTLSFSFVADKNFTNKAYNYIETIDFEYLKGSASRKVFRNDSEMEIDKSAFSSTGDNSVGTISAINEWMTISYNLQDLLDCYDQIILNDIFILGTPGFSYHDAINIYLTPITIS